MSDSAPTIRTIRAELDDLEILVPLFEAYRGFYGQSAEPERARAFLADRLTRDESVIFLAVIGGSAAGFTQMYPSYSSVSMRRIWILNDLFVVPDRRRSGAGRALLERGERWAAETGAKGLILATQFTNAHAQRLYERCGWKRDDEFLHYNRSL